MLMFQYYIQLQLCYHFCISLVLGMLQNHFRSDLDRMGYLLVHH